MQSLHCRWVLKRIIQSCKDAHMTLSQFNHLKHHFTLFIIYVRQLQIYRQTSSHFIGFLNRITRCILLRNNETPRASSRYVYIKLRQVSKCEIFCKIYAVSSERVQRIKDMNRLLCIQDSSNTRPSVIRLSFLISKNM